MPSAKPLSTLRQFRQAFGDAVRGERDKDADTRVGAVYDHFAGAPAILWTRDAARDRDLFRAIYFDTASGDDLTTYVSKRFGIDRVLDTRGTGTATLVRPNASFGADTIWAGSRIRVVGPLNTNQRYRVKTTTSVGAALTSIPVPIEATTYGPGTAIDTTTGLVLEDPQGDATWTVLRLTCGDGTTYEESAAFRARVRATRLLERRGYPSSIVRACQAAGAVNVVTFDSFWGTDMTSVSTDPGINAVYVGDANFSGAAALVNACQVACEDARSMGAQTYFGALGASSLSISLTVALSDDPSKFDQLTLGNSISAAVAGLFAGISRGFTYQLDSIRSAAHVSDAVQSVTVASPVSDVTLSSSAWPATLTRYVVRPTDVSIAFTGPS